MTKPKVRAWRDPHHGQIKFFPPFEGGDHVAFMAWHHQAMKAAERLQAKEGGREDTPIDLGEHPGEAPPISLAPSGSYPHALGAVEAQWLQAGDTVYELRWEATRSGGAGSFSVQRFGDAYFCDNEDTGCSGPFPTLIAALQSCDFDIYTSATLSVDCTELSAEALAALLRGSDDVEAGFQLILNGAPWVVDHDSRLEPVACW